MEKLPIRPLVFVPAYLLSSIVALLLTSPGLDIPGIWATLLGLTVFALHFTWMFRATAYASKRRSSIGRSLVVQDPPTTILRFLLMTFLCLGFGELYEAYLQPVLIEGTSLDEAIQFAIVLPTLYFLVGIFWISARTLCEAEMGRKAPTFGIVSTAIQFLVIFIGAPFIYRRLKSLNAPLLGGLPETA